MNDTYRVGDVEGGTKGGFGRVVTIIRQLQAEGRDVRVTHGGDLLYPSLESQLWNGEQMVEALNFLDDLAPTYLVAGNHEFDRRAPLHLQNAIRNSRFDWLGDNFVLLTGDATVDDALRSGFTFRHGDRLIGVFALTLHPDDGGNDRGYAPVDRDYLGAAERLIEDFEARGADAIIGLTHLHMADDIAISRLRTAHPRFVLVVGGHEHEPQQQALTASQAAVYKGASNARSIWRIDIDFAADGMPLLAATLIELDTSVPVDAAYSVLSDRWRDRLLDLYPFLDSRIGAAALPLDASEQTIRNEETNWGNFVVDQMRTAFGQPPADLAFINSGTLRIDDTIAGDIVFEDIARTFGFSSFLRYLPITGAEFRQLLEAGYRGSGNSKGYFPQVSGFRVCVDRRRPDGERIVSLQLAGADGYREIDAAAEYLLVMPDYLFGGGDGYRLSKARKQTASRPGSELKYLVLDAIVQAQAQGKAIGEPVDPAKPRFVELGAQREDCWSRH